MGQPDPGGNFASEYHRRIAALLPNPDEEPLSINLLMDQRVAKDDNFDVDSDELTELITDLEADGDAVKDETGFWKLTQAGFDALTGLNAWSHPQNNQTPEEAGRMHESAK